MESLHHSVMVNQCVVESAKHCGALSKPQQLTLYLWCGARIAKTGNVIGCVQAVILKNIFAL